MDSVEEKNAGDSFQGYHSNKIEQSHLLQKFRSDAGMWKDFKTRDARYNGDGDTQTEKLRKKVRAKILRAKYFFASGYWDNRLQSPEVLKLEKTWEFIGNKIQNLGLFEKLGCVKIQFSTNGNKTKLFVFFETNSSNHNEYEEHMNTTLGLSRKVRIYLPSDQLHRLAIRWRSK